VLTGLTVPARVVWCPQDDVRYLADSGSGTVTAYEYDVDLGTLGRPRPLLEFAGAAGAPAGLTVDLAGHVWLDCGAGVWCTGTATPGGSSRSCTSPRQTYPGAPSPGGT
jgi:sugar lactone lactonase YvrE